MYATQDGRRIGPLGGVELVEDATLVLPSSIHPLDDGAPRAVDSRVTTPRLDPRLA